MTPHQQIQEEVNKENWLTLEEAAQKIGITYSAMIKLLNKPTYQSIKENPQYMTKMRIGKKRKFVINSQGLVVLTTMKDGSRSNQHEDKKELSSLLHEGKKNVAEKAMIPSNYMDDPVIAMRIEQMQVEKRVTGVEKELQRIKGIIESPHLTKGQRDRLNERVRYLAKEAGIGYSEIWTALHKALGRISLEEYEFEDYLPAIKCLKNLYYKCNVTWNSLL